MTFARGKPGGDQILCAVEKDNPDIVTAMHENVAIGALQRRTSDHCPFTGFANPIDLVGNRLQPGPAILIGQRMAGAHLGHIGGGMKPVAILESPAQPFGQRFADGALAGAGYAHHDQRARWFG